MDTKGEKWRGAGGGVMNWKIGIDMYTLICIKWITNKNLLCKKKQKTKKTFNDVYHVPSSVIQKNPNPMVPVFTGNRATK